MCPTILTRCRRCKAEILYYQPDDIPWLELTDEEREAFGAASVIRYCQACWAIFPRAVREILVMEEFLR